jgi:hypothetical protein
MQKRLLPSTLPSTVRIMPYQWLQYRHLLAALDALPYRSCAPTEVTAEQRTQREERRVKGNGRMQKHLAIWPSKFACTLLLLATPSPPYPTEARVFASSSPCRPDSDFSSLFPLRAFLRDSSQTCTGHHTCKRLRPCGLVLFRLFVCQ